MNACHPRSGRPLTLPPRRTRRQAVPLALRPLTLALALAGVAITLPGQAAGPALPAGLQVVQGQATLAASANRLTVTNSANALLNWQQFSIGAGNSVHFAQPDAASKVLNRVVGSDPSLIFGSLSSNGQVWLLNPNGVLFGASARVDVAGLVASTLRLNDADWAARRLSLAGSADGAFSSAGIVNQGELRTPTGGRVLLIGGASVRNEGLIAAPGGQVLLAAGRSIDLVDASLPHLAVRLAAPQGEAVNLGSIVTSGAVGGGRIDLQAAMVNQQGIVRADSLGTARGGEVLLAAGSGVQLAAGSLTSASGAAGGSVWVDGGSGSTLLGGTLAATGQAGAGGNLTLLGRQVGLQGGALADASGAAGGGAVRVGGGVQGRDAAFRHAEAVFMAPGARIAADATAAGDGGLVVLWSDRATRVYGSLSAQGGPLGGDGGFIETSGGWLDARPAAVHTGAPRGRAGTWLLDPDNILITSETSDVGIVGGPDFTTNTANGQARLSTATLAAALNAGSNVSVTTSVGSAASVGRGDITVSAAQLNASPPTPVSLTLNAIGSILVDNSTLASQGAPLSLRLVAGYAGGNVGQADGGTANGGAVRIGGSTLNSRGGDIVIGGNSIACGQVNGCATGQPGAVASSASQLFDGIAVLSSTLDAGSGRISLTGTSLVSFTDTAGVRVADASLLAARSIDIRGTVDSSGNVNRRGVALADSTLAATERLAITGAVYSGTFRPDTQVVGIDVQGDALLRIGSANAAPGALLLLQGSVQEAAAAGAPAGEFGAQPRIGVALRGFSSRVQALGGAVIDIVGNEVSANGDYGIVVSGVESASIDATAGSQLTLRSAGNILLTGELLAPTGGGLTVQAGDKLTIDQAMLGGTPAQVSLSAATLAVGSSGLPTQLVFGGATQLALRAGKLLLGANGPAPTDNDPQPTEQALPPAGPLPQRHALAVAATAFNPPEATTVVATGGAISVQADSLQFGSNAVLYSSAPGTAISVRGLATPGVAVLSNFGGAGALAAPNGRWLLQGQDLGDPRQPFLPGALAAAFLQYGVDGNAPVPAQGGNGFLFTATPVLALAGGTAPGKPYDGGTALPAGNVNGPTVTGLKDGDRLVGSLRFADKNAGLGKPLVLAAADSGNTATTAEGLPVYGYQPDAAKLVGNITPLALSLSAASVADKRYDGGTTGTVTGWTLAGVLPGDGVQVQAGSARFATAGVGSAKAVTATASSLAGADAGNYTVNGQTVNTTAAIGAAPLLYLADAASVVQGQALPAFSGQVTGFVAGEGLGNATSGTPRFDSAVASSAAPGSYAINGSGLAAANYTLAQAASNAMALTLLPPGGAGGAGGAVASAGSLPVNPFVTGLAVAAVLPLAQGTSPDSGRALDALQAVLPGAGEPLAFAALDLANMSPAAVAAVLAARDEYKKTVFQPALTLLEADPARADAPGCATAQQAASGQCLISTPLAGGLAMSNARVVDRTAGDAAAAAAAAAPPAVAAISAPPGAPPTAAQAAAQTGAPATPQATPQAAAQAATQAASRAAAQPPQPLLDLPARRTVRTATLPQIQRKIAVLIGIDQYNDARIPRLGNAVSDARAVAAVLEGQLGYQTVVLANANRAGIFRALNQLVGQVGPADSVVLYYAGHGERAEKTGLGYWQPADADPTRPDTWISNADIDRLMRALPASQVAMISDSCFSGSLVSGERIRGVASAQDPGTLLGRRAAVVMTSGGNEPVFDSGKNGHSPFAWSLMQSLQQVAGWKPGSTLFEQVRFAVARQLPQRPQYAAAPGAGHESGADYLFEQRQLTSVVK